MPRGRKGIVNTISQTYCKAQALALVAALIEDSRWFQVEPQPFDVYEITVKNEQPLPEPLGRTDVGQQVGFNDWLTAVERHFDAVLDKDTREVFLDYFIRGLTPSEAIQQDREDEGT